MSFAAAKTPTKVFSSQRHALCSTENVGVVIVQMKMATT
jgi:hypothetical protein